MPMEMGWASSNDNAADSVPAAESEAMTLEKELALEGNEGLGDDGRVRFYVAVCPAHGTSLHILAIPSLEPVFQYNFESHPLERVGLTSGSSDLLSVSMRPQLLISWCLNVMMILQKKGAMVTIHGRDVDVEDESPSPSSKRLHTGNRSVYIVDIALHFVGGLGSSSPTLVMALATSSGDVYVYHLHRAPEELEHAWIRNLVKKQGNVKAMGIADVSSVPLADLDLSGDIMRGISKPSEPLSASPLSSTGKVIYLG